MRTPRQHAIDSPAEPAPQSYRFEVRATPIGKARPRLTARGNHVYTPAKTVSAERSIAWAARAAGVRPIDGPVVLDVVACMPIPASWSRAKRLAAVGQWHEHKPDVDNLFKTVADALNRIAYRDDAQIVAASVSRLYALEPRTIVVVRAAEASDMPKMLAAE